MNEGTEQGGMDMLKMFFILIVFLAAVTFFYNYGNSETLEVGALEGCPAYTCSV